MRNRLQSDLRIFQTYKMKSPNFFGLVDSQILLSPGGTKQGSSWILERSPKRQIHGPRNLKKRYLNEFNIKFVKQKMSIYILVGKLYSRFNTFQ